MRNKICDYLATNKPIMDGISTVDILAMEHPNYIEHMRCPSTWGGAIEIQAAVNMYSARIFVENRRDRSGNIEFLPIGVEPIMTLTIYWTGGHYEPVSITKK